MAHGSLEGPTSVSALLFTALEYMEVVFTKRFIAPIAQTFRRS